MNEEVKYRLETEIINRLDGLEGADPMETKEQVEQCCKLCDKYTDIVKLDLVLGESQAKEQSFTEEMKNKKKDRRFNLITQLAIAIIPVLGYIGLHTMAMKYEDEDHVFRLSSTKTNLGKANVKK
mgnify:CR=1 FL=1